jgi:DNA-binding protein HU-beta
VKWRFRGPRDLGNAGTSALFRFGIGKLRTVVRKRCYVALGFVTPGKEGIVTKSEFVDQVADRSGLGKGEADKAVNAVLDTIEEVLTRGGEINFTGFGKFSVADRGARQGVNPQTGEKIQIAASRVPRFSAGSGLKKAVKTS